MINLIKKDEFYEMFSNKNISECVNVQRFKTHYDTYEFNYYFYSGELVLSNSTENIAWYKTGIVGTKIPYPIMVDLYDFYKNQYSYVMISDIDRQNKYSISRLNPVENEDTCEFISYNGDEYKIQLEMVFNDVLCNIYNSLGDKIASTKRLNDTLLFRWIQGEVEFYEEIIDEQ